MTNKRESIPLLEMVKVLSAIALACVPAVLAVVLFVRSLYTGHLIEPSLWFYHSWFATGIALLFALGVIEWAALLFAWFASREHGSQP